MSEQITMTIATDVLEEIKRRQPDKISKSEFIESLIRWGLQHLKDKEKSVILANFKSNEVSDEE